MRAAYSRVDQYRFFQVLSLDNLDLIKTIILRLYANMDKGLFYSRSPGGSRASKKLLG
jgi:hypothetical protein